MLKALLPLIRMSEINPFSCTVKINPFPSGVDIASAVTSRKKPILKIVLISALMSASQKGLPTLLLICWRIAEASIFRFPLISILTIFWINPARLRISVLIVIAIAPISPDPLPEVEKSDKALPLETSTILASKLKFSPNWVKLP